MAGDTMFMGNLSITSPSGRLSNPGGARKRGETTYWVSLDQFNQLKSKCEILEAQFKKLDSKGWGLFCETKRAGFCYSSLHFVVLWLAYLVLKPLWGWRNSNRTLRLFFYGLHKCRLINHSLTWDWRVGFQWWISIGVQSPEHTCFTAASIK